MKVLVATCLIALALAVRAPLNKEVAEVRDAIKQFPGTTIIVLYDAGADQNRTDTQVKEVQQTLIKDNDDYQFFKTEIPVDALKEDDNSMDPERFIDELQINAISLKHAPTVVATRKGWAYWAHGDGAVGEVKKELKSFDAKARASNPHAQKQSKKQSEENGRRLRRQMRMRR